MTSPLFEAFLSIARALNERGLVPLLMGSVGLEVRTGQSWYARDLDIHVPGDRRGWEAPDHLRIYDFELLEGLMEDLGYVLILCQTLPAWPWQTCPWKTVRGSASIYLP